MTKKLSRIYAEARTPGIPHKTNGAPILVNGQTIWKEYDDFDYDTDLFLDIGCDFEQLCLVKLGTVGSANCRLFRQRPAVDFVVEWLNGNHKNLQGYCSVRRASEKQI
ncbi:MAG: AAC(3) family N-acetyltransferase [Bacillota bacterium]